MAPILALALAVAICFALFRKEVSKFDANPMIIALLGIALVVLTHDRGKVVQFGPLLWSSYWLPQMLAIIILFLLFIIPGPRLSALLNDERSNGYKAITSTLIGILICVLVGMIAMAAASHNFPIPLLLNR